MIDEEDARVPPAAGVVAIKVPGAVSIVPGVLAFCDSSWGTKLADPVRWKVSTSRLGGPKKWPRAPPVTTRLVTLGGALPTVSWEVPRMSRMLPAPSEIWLVALGPLLCMKIAPVLNIGFWPCPTVKATLGLMPLRLKPLPVTL